METWMQQLGKDKYTDQHGLYAIHNDKETRIVPYIAGILDMWSNSSQYSDQINNVWTKKHT